MKNIAEYLYEKYGKWGWMGQRAHDAAAINEVLPLDFIISCDYGLDVPLYFSEDNMFSLEKKEKVRRDWSNEDLKKALSGNFGKEIYRKWKDEDGDVNLLCYRSVKKLENYGRNGKNRLNIFAVSEEMKYFFDNKIRLYKELKNLSLPRIPSKVSRMVKEAFPDICSELGRPFVVQFPYGSSGHLTFFIEEEGQYSALSSKYPEEEVIIRKYIKGESLNVNAVIMNDRNGVNVYASFPSIQIVGVKECSNFKAAYCGNDYTLSQQLDKNILKQVKHCVKKIGKWMHSKGYQGIFGMDFLIEDGTVYPVEINPRFQNSTSLHNALDILSGKNESALFFMHIAEFLQEKDKKMRDYVNSMREEDIFRPLSGAQLIVHNKDEESVMAGQFIPGIYRINRGKVDFVRKGAVLSDCETREDVLITCGVPAKGMRIKPNAPVCKIQTRRNILSRNNIEIEGNVKKIVEFMYNKISFMEPSKV